MSGKNKKHRSTLADALDAVEIGLSTGRLKNRERVRSFIKPMLVNSKRDDRGRVVA